MLFRLLITFLYQLPSPIRAVSVKMQCISYFPTTCNVYDLEMKKNDILEYDKVTPKLNYLSFENCKFDEFPFQVFADFPKIQSFFMIQTGLLMLNTNSFAHAKKLEFLSFQDSNIVSLKDKVFFDLSHVNGLELVNCSLTFISADAFLVKFFFTVKS